MPTGVRVRVPSSPPSSLCVGPRSRAATRSLLHEQGGVSWMRRQVHRSLFGPSGSALTVGRALALNRPDLREQCRALRRLSGRTTPPSCQGFGYPRLHRGHPGAIDRQDGTRATARPTPVLPFPIPRARGTPRPHARDEPGSLARRPAAYPHEGRGQASADGVQPACGQRPTGSGDGHGLFLVQVCARANSFLWE